MEKKGFLFEGTDGEAELTLDQVKELADQNDPDGLYALAMAYLFGWDVEEDEDKGYQLLEKAVELDQKEAKALMVRLFMEGYYYGIDAEGAAQLAIDAADNGVQESLLYAGLAYMDGVSVEQDYAKAAKYFSSAANKGDQEARNSLAYLYQNGLGVEMDPQKAFKMYRTAARGGSVNAMFQVAICYEFGEGTNVDMEQAMHWYHEGADKGDAFAMERIGVLTSIEDPELGFEWLLKAALEGVPSAMCTVGLSYMAGDGVQKDLDEARKWLKLAVDNGEEEAVEALAELDKYRVRRPNVDMSSHVPV